MTDRLAEQGAVQYAQNNPSSSGVSRLGGAGYLQAAIADALSSGLSSLNGSRIGGKGRIYALAASAGPRFLFNNSEVGVWYDPSDITSMFQDSAGTTAAVVGQPVGKILDKSGNGYHATQATSTARPILGRHPITGRRNLLTYTEDFGNAVWAKSSVTGSGLSIRETAVTSAHFLEAIVTLTGTVVYSTEIKAVGRDKVKLTLGTISATYAIFYTFSTNTFSSPGTAFVSYISEVLADGYVRITLVSNAGADRCRFALTDNGVESYLGDVNKGLDVRNTQLELGSTPTAYQKVVSTYDVTEAGVNYAYYLKFDGVDDFLVTQSIDFSATDKMSVFAGVRKLSDAARSILVEFSTNVGTFTGVFNIEAPFDTTNDYSAYSDGSSAFSSSFRALANDATYAAPHTAVVTMSSSIPGDLTTLRINTGTTGVTNGSGDQGTGAYGNYQLYIGMRAGTSLPFNGHLYSLVVRGALSDAAQITAAESFVNSKTGAY